VDVDGFLAEYAVAPANILWKNSKDIRWDIQCLQESLGARSSSMAAVAVCSDVN
jgi:threonine dehydrogenase-like Zn-dependent dehydrogenase